METNICASTGRHLPPPKRFHLHCIDCTDGDKQLLDFAPRDETASRYWTAVNDFNRRRSTAAQEAFKKKGWGGWNAWSGRCDEQRPVDAMLAVQIELAWPESDSILQTRDSRALPESFDLKALSMLLSMLQKNQPLQCDQTDWPLSVSELTSRLHHQHAALHKRSGTITGLMKDLETPFLIERAVLPLHQRVENAWRAFTAPGAFWEKSCSNILSTRFHGA